MTWMNSLADIIRKTLAVGALITSFSATSSVGSSTFGPTPTPFWQVSDASTFEPVRTVPNVAAIKLVLRELQITRSILGLKELLGEVAFFDYLRAVDDALTSYEQQGKPINNGAIHLATALAVARTTLHDGVSDLSSWLAILRMMGVEEHFVAVPERFVALSETETPRKESWSQEDVETWLDLDSMGI